MRTLQSIIILVIFVTNNLQFGKAEDKELNLNCLYQADNQSEPSKLTCKLYQMNLKWTDICTLDHQINHTTLCLLKLNVTASGTEEEKRNTTTVWFQNSYIQIIPSIIFEQFPNLEEIRIRSFNETTIEKSVFRNMTSLKRLNLANFNGTEPEAFDTLTNLEVLDLSFNEIEELPPNVLQKNIKLKKLLLNVNNLKYFNESFVEYLENLEVINLSDNKEIDISSASFQYNIKLKEIRLFGIMMEEIKEFVFDNLFDLEVVDLSSNLLSEIPSTLFKDNIKLKEIYLSGNQISQLDENIFKNLVDLEKVKLNGNNISKISPGLFDGNKKLSYLDIRYNNLKNIDELSFFIAIPSLTQLYYSGSEIIKCLSLPVVLLIAISTFLL